MQEDNKIKIFFSYTLFYSSEFIIGEFEQRETLHLDFFFIRRKLSYKAQKNNIRRVKKKRIALPRKNYHVHSC